MKTIAIEEHFKIPAIIEANSGGAQEKAFKLFGSTGIYSTGEDGEVPAGSLDIGLKRLAAMDTSGIDVQVLSLNQPATENLEPELAVKLAAMANDKIAAAVTAHPTRFGGFATLPMPNPKASAAELERMVTNHGFLGALIHGHIRGRYLERSILLAGFRDGRKARRAHLSASEAPPTGGGRCVLRRIRDDGVRNSRNYGVGVACRYGPARAEAHSWRRLRSLS